MAPFRDVFSALFFVSVGMLFNPAIVIAQPLLVLAALAIVLVVKPLVAVAIVMALRDTRRTALTVGVGLAQIGEFSFILGVLGTSLGILPPEAMEILVVAAILSIAVNPLLFRAAGWIEARLSASFGAEPEVPVAITAVAPRAAALPVILTGLGEVGRRLVRRCAENGVPVCVVDSDPALLGALGGQAIATFRGNPGQQDVLEAAGAAEARMIVVTDTQLADKMRICIAARAVNPRIAIVATSGSSAERVWLEEFGAAYVCDALDELTEGLLRSVRSGL